MEYSVWTCRWTKESPDPAAMNLLAPLEELESDVCDRGR
jgi:hypothetical protein